MASRHDICSASQPNKFKGGVEMSKNTGFTKKEAEQIAKPLNTSVSIAYVVREDHFRSSPPSHEYVIEIRKRS